LLEKAIPEHLRARTRAEGTSWFGFSTRARVIVYDKSRVKPEDVDSYEKLALPVNKNKLCVRSGSHPYNLSLFGAMVEHLGAPATEVWLKDLVGNMARSPKGGDTDQIKAVGSGECGIALANSYYVARLLRSGAQQDQALMQRVGVIFPNQASWGTHMNIAGGAVAQHAKHPANAQKFLEYLSSPSAQAYFADGNNEWPVVKGVQINNPALQTLAGSNFKTDPLPVSFIGMN
jgi:iron(III) transport system substrate-binding protein